MSIHKQSNSAILLESYLGGRYGEFLHRWAHVRSLDDGSSAHCEIRYKQDSRLFKKTGARQIKYSLKICPPFLMSLDAI
jgi:hypothetical protein